MVAWGRFGSQRTGCLILCDVPYDSQATRERILVAATTEFAERGIAGARIDRIAAQAGANKRAIYDYFHDKEGLFGAVLERSMIKCAEAVQINHGDMASYARRLFDYHSAHPEMLRLQIWEALEYGTRDVPAERMRTEMYQDRVDSAAESFHSDPATLVFFAMALVNWSLSVPQLRRMVLGKDHSPELLKHNIAEAVRVLTRTQLPSME